MEEFWLALLFYIDMQLHATSCCPCHSVLPILQEEFEQYAETAKTRPELSNENKLFIYGLYKQATISNQPSRIFNMDRAKRDAWKSVAEKSEEEEAMNNYITKRRKL